jgi:hypothetical protein
MRSIKNSVEMTKKLSDFIQSVRQEACDMDRKAMENGKIIKYIFEIKKDNNVDLAFLYSDIHLSHHEALNRADVQIKKGDDINIRGPFPLREGALADSRILRWEREKRKSEEDEKVISRAKERCISAGDKYLYVVVANSYGIDRVVDFRSSQKALSKNSVTKMIKKVYYGTGHVVRVCLLSGEEKRYES